MLTIEPLNHSVSIIQLKGESNEIFHILFFIKQFLLVPVEKLGNNFAFFRIVVQLFDYFDASLVSTIVLLKLDDPFEY